MLLEMRHITKTYGSVVANDDVSIQLDKGEILAIVGENGAGKSTLMKILYGLEHADAGEILLQGQPVHFRAPGDAMRRGIGMVQQHFMLFGSMTITENIVYNNELRRGGIFYDRQKNRDKIVELAQRYQLAVDPDAIVEDCPVGMQQRVEILKTLYQNADIIIFDEPSAVLTPIEVDDLLQTLRALAGMGKSIVLITHKLNEVMAVSDRVVVMRDGRVVATVKKDQTDVEELSFLMVGRHIEPPHIDPPHTEGTLLRVEDLTLPSGDGRLLLDDVDLHVDYGEIVGIAGVSGNGQTELVRCLTGLETEYSGSIELAGRQLAGQTVEEFREAGVAHIPEDRYVYGSAAQATLADNALMGNEHKPPFSKHGVLALKEVNRNAARLIDEYDVKATSVFQRMRELSGGNAQKLVAAREIAHKTGLLVASEPTRGIDVGAMEFIHNKLLERRADGDAVLLVSSELSEIMKLSDRIYVIYEGRINGEFARNSANERELGLLMVGGRAGA